MSDLLSLRFHPPDHDFEIAHLKSRNGPDMRAVECNHHRTAFDAAHPMWAGIVEDLQTIRGRARRRRMLVWLAALPVGRHTLITRAASRNDNRAPSSAWTRTSSGVARPPISADARLGRLAWSLFGCGSKRSHPHDRHRGCRRTTRPNSVSTWRVR